MNTFLNQPDATFYHITTWENWQSIQSQGLFSRTNKIFVSRIGEFPALAAIIVEQLPEMIETPYIVILKLPQEKNNFQDEEIFQDNQAGNEITKPFQNIIRRRKIPFANIEFMMRIKNHEFIIDELNRIAGQFNVNYPNHSIYKHAQSLKINELPS
ncbi:MAG: hypothetical protein JWM28_1594, partial [Chitinophagaceae bacterium]|nr:hypothetical protein [Chitinophagaceae bacterium]